MREITKFKTRKTLFTLAIISFVIATLEGFLYYNQYDNVFFRLLLVIQNSINAFGFKSTISIKDAMGYIEKNPTLLHTIIGYAYGIAVFTAPYCTIAVVYKMLERIFRAVFMVRKRKNHEHLIIFGYNDDVKAILTNYSSQSDDKNNKLCIHIVTAADLSSEEHYSMTKRNYMVHIFDCLKASDDEVKYLLKQASIGKASNIILFEESSVQNFSLLQMFKLDKNDFSGKIALQTGAKIFCRCEEDSISRLIADYYDNRDADSFGYDLEIVSLPELQVHKMYRDYPLYTYYANTDKKLSEWNLNILIAGFGKVGQQALLQAMSLGVVSSYNDINIDVIDYDVDNKAEIFANQLSAEMFDMDSNRYSKKQDTADGKLNINFHSMNVRHKQFYNLIKGSEGTVPYNYVIIAIDNIDVSVDCAMDLVQALENCGKESVPIILRMDTDKRLVNYIKNNNGTLPNVKLLPDRSKVLTIDMIIDKHTDEKAKRYNHFYNALQILNKGENPKTDNNERNIEDEWNDLALFRRDSNRAAAYHEEVKNFVLKRLAQENGYDINTKLDELIGTHGNLLEYDGSVWILKGTEQDFIEALKKDKFAYEAASLEHRRWCYFMLSKGWRCGERSDKRRQNPCIVTQDKLMKIKPDMVKYDLMTLMAMYKNNSKEKEI